MGLRADVAVVLSGVLVPWYGFSRSRLSALFLAPALWGPNFAQSGVVWGPHAIASLRAARNMFTCSSAQVIPKAIRLCIGWLRRSFRFLKDTLQGWTGMPRTGLQLQRDRMGSPGVSRSKSLAQVSRCSKGKARVFRRFTPTKGPRSLDALIVGRLRF